jgi:hypothetical protein
MTPPDRKFSLWTRRIYPRLIPTTTGARKKHVVVGDWQLALTESENLCRRLAEKLLRQPSWRNVSVVMLPEGETPNLTPTQGA